MPSKKPTPPSKKIAVLPARSKKEGAPPDAWADTDGLTGEGTESVMAHLRELEKLRTAGRLQKSARDKTE